MVNVYRAVAGIKTPVGYRRPGALGRRAGRAEDKWDEDEE